MRRFWPGRAAAASLPWRLPGLQVAQARLPPAVNRRQAAAAASIRARAQERGCQPIPSFLPSEREFLLRIIIHTCIRSYMYMRECVFGFSSARVGSEVRLPERERERESE